ncbi:MAG: hypothetical protein ACLVDB_07740 [Anaeromassilibacillus sp.]
MEAVNYMADYAKRLREMIQKGVNAADYEHPLKGFHIVVDAGNGAGGFYASDVLAPLGADVTGSQFLEPDGMFPNHIPNPENEEAMQSICKAVLDAKADMGVIFDTDVDRGGAVDARGEEINRNRLVAIASAIALRAIPAARSDRLHHVQLRNTSKGLWAASTIALSVATKTSSTRRCV